MIAQCSPNHPTQHLFSPPEKIASSLPHRVIPPLSIRFPWERSATESVVRRVAWFKVKTPAITRWISLTESMQSAKWIRLVLAATEQKFLQTHNGTTSIHVVFLLFLSCAKCDECWRHFRKWIWSLSARRWTDAKPMLCVSMCVCESECVKQTDESKCL